MAPSKERNLWDDVRPTRCPSIQVMVWSLTSSPASPPYCSSTHSNHACPSACLRSRPHVLPLPLAACLAIRLLPRQIPPSCHLLALYPFSQHMRSSADRPLHDRDLVFVLVILFVYMMLFVILLVILFLRSCLI